jgi:RimJ/RimL family protein N-acetyltransferase
MEPVTLRADGFVLRPWRDDDVPAVLSALLDPAVARWNPADGPAPDLAVAAAWVAGRADWSGGQHASLAISAADDDGELLGSVSLFRIDRVHDNAEMGYWVAAGARGRGVAVTAVRALTAWSFTTLGLARVQLFHAVENPASCRVAEKAGFRLEGTARRSYRYGDGELHDEHLHGRLATDAADPAGPAD